MLTIRRPLAVLLLLSVCVAGLATDVNAAPVSAIPETIDATIQSMGASEAFFSGASSSASSSSSMSAPVETPIPFSLIGFDVPAGESVTFRTSADGQQWLGWETLAESEDGPDASPDVGDGRVPTEPMWVGASRWLQIKAHNPAAVSVHLVDSLGQSGGDVQPAPAKAEPTFYAAAANQPRIITRVGWGADESISRSSDVATSARHVVVHHTATRSAYTASEVPAILRSIHRYHAMTRRWGDIGYNFLIDQFGQIYEGRRGGVTKAVIGAHARGFNTGSVGISLIGDFDSAEPSPAALLALRKLLAWKMSIHGIDPTGAVTVTSAGSPKYASGRKVTLPTINGHRDTGETSCPGTNLYAKLPAMRTIVKAEMTQRSVSVADYARQCLPEGDPNVGPVWRAQGENRIATAIQASRWYWRTANTAIVANAYDFPDALSAGALAAKHDAPILLTAGERLHPAVGKRLSELGTKRVYVMGGPSSVSARVETDLAKLGVAVTRVAGHNRFATAAAAAGLAGADSGEVTLALGTHEVATRAWPDAVAAGALVATPQRLPTLLTHPGALPTETRDALRSLNVKTVWILGDDSAVSSEVERQITDLKIDVHRLAGNTRYGTSVAATKEARRRLTDSDVPIVFASGANFPDALAGAAVAARRGAPLLLVPPCGLEQAPEIMQYLESSADTYSEGTILGSPAAVSDRVRWQIGTQLGGNG